MEPEYQALFLYFKNSIALIVYIISAFAADSLVKAARVVVIRRNDDTAEQVTKIAKGGSAITVIAVRLVNVDPLTI